MSGRAMITILAAAGIAATAASPAGVGAATHATTPRWSEAGTCLGAHDLNVATGTTIALGASGSYHFDRLCIENGATLQLSDSTTLRVGDLLVADGASLVSNGSDGVEQDTHDCIDNHVQPDGAPGGTLTIIARRAVIAGSISSSGGAGLSYRISCQGSTDIGQGGAGGRVTLVAGSLSFAGRIVATGGAGGSSDAQQAGLLPESHRPSGAGGAGGVVTVSAPGAVALIRGHVVVTPGSGGAPDRGAATGRRGASGVIRARAAPAGSSLPAAAPPIVAIAASGPTPAVLGPASASACLPGGGALVIRAGTTRVLGGVIRAPRVCVRGRVVVHGFLTLQARSIVIAHGGSIVASGASALPDATNEQGRYDAVGPACGFTAVPHAGEAGMSEQPTSESTFPHAGGGGGSLRLVAPSVWIDGRIDVSGGRGADGQAMGFGSQTYQDGGAGGGSGGGVLVIASRLRLGSGALIDARGGSGGSPSDSTVNNGKVGSLGCVVLAASTLDAPASFPALGPVFLLPAPSLEQTNAVRSGLHARAS